MACDGAFATADEYTSFFCKDSRLSRVHTGENNAAILTDSMARFRTKGVESNVGMIVYNLTDGSQGVVTAVDDNNITAPLEGGTENLWDAGDEYLIVTIDATDRASVEYYLAFTAADVHSAMAAQGACDCTLSAWGLQLAKKLNIIDAASFVSCGCMNKLSDVERQQYRNWMDARLEEIRMGKVDLCEGGGSGSEAPAFGSVKEAVTVFAQAQIISDRNARESG
jgi:hypothetical protein